MPQPVGSDGASGGVFAAFDAPISFAQDPAALEKRFYQVSRLLHPDRFTLKGPEAQRLSLERMSFVNQAYQTLKDPAVLRDLLLEAHGLKVSDQGARGQVPMELAESWFELQDALSEDPEAARARLAGFETELAALKTASAARLRATEAEIDRLGHDLAVPAWENLLKQVRELSYLQSMERDVKRIRDRLK
jgi:molecular chaperone HscB